MLNNLDIFIGEETWLNDDVPEMKLNFPGFFVVRRDRTYSRGGGIIILIRKNLEFKT